MEWHLRWSQVPEAGKQLCAGCGGRGRGPGVGVGVGTMGHCVLWSHCHSCTLGFPFLSITLPLGWTSIKINGGGIQSSASGPSVLAWPAVDSGGVVEAAAWPRPGFLAQPGGNQEGAPAHGDVWTETYPSLVTGPSWATGSCACPWESHVTALSSVYSSAN